MIVAELKIYNFRQFKSVNNKPGLQISFHKGLNALIGENDSGKTAVIDALKLVLLTQSNEYANKRIEDYFIGDTDGKRILQTIRSNLESFSDKGQASDAELKTSDIQLKAILESLSLNAPEINPGLGEWPASGFLKESSMFFRFCTQTRSGLR